MRTQTRFDSEAQSQPPFIQRGVVALQDVLPERFQDCEREGFLYIPTNYTSDDPMPLVTMFHGAGGSGGQMISALKDVAEELGLLLLAPDSRGTTWDLKGEGKAEEDSDFITAAIESVREKFQIQDSHSAIAGFSDGASYALSVGLSMGHEFSHIIAVAPGFMSPQAIVDHPKILIIHGKSYPVLNIDRTSRKIVPSLRALDLTVDYVEHEGGHTLSATHVKQAMVWFLKNDAARNLDSEQIDTRSQGIERT